MRSIAPLFVLLACNQESGLEVDTDRIDTDIVADSGDTDVATDSGDTEPPPPAPVRFVALGDAGEGNAAQFAVADVIETVCASRGCDFALYLGDNIYDSGVDGVNDEQFQTKFEQPYADLDFPFFAVLGNHDLGGGGLGLDLDPNKGTYEVEYTQHSQKWKMFDKYYIIPEEYVPQDLVRFYALNTTDIFFGNEDTQKAWLDFEVPASNARWNIAFGHHPYISNGTHGNAGAYEYNPDDWYTALIPSPANGAHVKSFIEDTMCDGQIDVYFAGHDHNRQVLGKPSDCDTYFVVSGAGAKTTEFVDRDPQGSGGRDPKKTNVTAFQDDALEGFAWVEIDGDTMTLYFYDREGTESGPYTYTR